MAITAADIENQSFSISKKGYDVDEVDVFLERVAEEIDEMNNLIAELRAGQAQQTPVSEPEEVEEEEEYNENDYDELSDDPQLIIREKDKIIEELREKLDAKQADDSVISQALIVAQRSADEIIANANTKADVTIADAHDEADRIVKRAEAEKSSIMQQISKLEEDREGSKNGYATLLRDIIDDANQKLSVLGFDEDIDAIPYDDVPALTEVQDDGSFFEGVDLGKTSALEPVSSVMEKDMSGFGDVADDSDDID